MPIGDFLNKLAAAFVMRENAQNGNTAAAQSSQQASEAGLLRRAQAAQIAQHMQLAPAMQAAQIKQMEAHADAYRTPKPSSVGDSLPVMNDDGTVAGYIGKKPGPDGNLPRFDNQGRPVGTVHPNILQSAVPANGTASAQSSPSSSPITPVAAVTTPDPSFPATYRTKPKPAPRAPKAPHLVAGTDATTGNSTWGTPGAPGFLPPLTTVEKTRRDQATHVISQGAALIAELNNPETQKIMGPRAGLWTGLQDSAIGGALTGGAPPAATHLASSLSSMSAFLPIMHGMRGGDNMIQHFEKQMGKNGELAVRRTPEAVQAAVTALVEAAKRIREHGDQADLSDLTPSLGTPAGPGAGPSRPGGFRVIGVRPAQ